MRLRWIGAGMLVLAGCVSQVDREAISFPDMPDMPIYHRADSQQLSPDQAAEALQTAEAACRTQPASGAAASPVGSSAFDSCMAGQGYRRVR